MKRQNERGAFYKIVLLVTVILLSHTFTVAQSLDTNMDRILRATVLISQTSEINNKTVVNCVSSGTIVSRDGLIITTAHSVTQSDTCSGDRLVVSLNVRNDEPAIPTYQADIVQLDEGLDIALLRIRRDFDGRLLDINQLSLPFVELADSSFVQLDDTISAVGYPAIDGQGLSVVRATVQGFTAEPSAGSKSWIKIRTDLSETGVIAGAMSGGGAYNRNGQLIGIPTTAPVSTASGAVSECRNLQDTNQDGIINSNDYCIPIGGAINVLRPSNFIRPLLRASSLGLQVEKLNISPTVSSSIAGEPRVNKLFFAPSVTANNMPTSVISNRLPSGSDSLYFFFDYENMSPETVYELRVVINGSISPVFSQSPVRWSGGENGLWYIGNTGQVWPNGEYEFTLIINGIAVGEPLPFEVGGGAQTEPSFSDITFGLIEGNQMFNSAPVLATGNTVRAQFVFNNMEPGLEWAAIWYYERNELDRVVSTWNTDQGINGAESTGLVVDTGFPPGQYRLELYINNRLASLADFVVAGARDETLPLPRVFNRDEMRFVVAQSPQEAVNAQPITTFTNELDSLYAIFDWEQVARGTPWRMVWSVDGQPFYDQTTPWNLPDTGENFLVRLSGQNGIPDGTYTMELSINGVTLGRVIEIDVGIGQLPIDAFVQADGVQVRGQIFDSDTQTGIANVTVMIISEDFSVDEFELRQDQLYATATTDRNGFFSFDRPLQYDRPYSLLITGYGYLPIAADGISLTQDSPNPLEWVIYMTRD